MPLSSSGTSCGKNSPRACLATLVSQMADQNSHASSATSSFWSVVAMSMYCTTLFMCGISLSSCTSSSMTSAWHTRLRTSSEGSVATAKRCCR